MTASQSGRFCPVAVVTLLLMVPSTAARCDPTSQTPEADGSGPEDSEQGMVVRYGPVVASFQFFGDVGATYDQRPPAAAAHASLVTGSFDFFSSVRLSDHLQTLAEIVAEFDDDTNEVAFELERLWGAYARSDAFYLKLGREHSPVSRWNRRYHHGRIYWPAASQPFVARFEDQGGLLPIHQSGLELGGTWRGRAGALSYTGVVSNGRGFERVEVTNATDRNDQKAWDAGVAWAPPGSSTLKLGLNYHHDRIPADPAVIGAEDLRESIATIFGEFRAGRLEAQIEVVAIEHEAIASAQEFRNRSGYLQVNFNAGDVVPYGRLDIRSMEQDDPFYSPDDLDLDRWEAIAGVRLGLGDHGALKIEGGYSQGEERDSGTGAIDRRGAVGATLALEWGF